MATFDPYRLTLARWAAGKTKKELATGLGVSPASVTQYEAGKTRPPGAVVAQMALVLGVPTTYFDRDESRRYRGKPTRSFFRSLRATRQWERDQADALAEHVYDLVSLLEQRVSLPQAALPEAAWLGEHTPRSEIEALAAEVREAWDVPTNRPVSNMVRLLEVHGAVVCRLDNVSHRLDAFSRWFETRPLVVLGAGKVDKARSRFDAAHELGHLVMHHEPDYSDRLQERQAHAFAAAFLMPADAIMGHLLRRAPRRSDWDELGALRQSWGVSIAALLYRARELGTLSEAGFRRAMTRYSELGMREHDGEALGPPEQPRLLEEAVRALLRHKGWSLDDLARELRFGRRQLEAVLGGNLQPTAVEREPVTVAPGGNVVPFRQE